MFEFLNYDSPIEEIVFTQLIQRLPGTNIKRQESIGRYRVDFLFPEANLIVECDGEQYHQDKNKDWVRDKYLITQGFTVLHFTGKQIYKELVKKDCSQNTGEYDLIDVIKYYYSVGVGDDE